MVSSSPPTPSFSVKEVPSRRVPSSTLGSGAGAAGSPPAVPFGGMSTWSGVGDAAAPTSSLSTGVTSGDAEDAICCKADCSLRLVRACSLSYASPVRAPPSVEEAGDAGGSPSCFCVGGLCFGVMGERSNARSAGSFWEAGESGGNSVRLTFELAL